MEETVPQRRIDEPLFFVFAFCGNHSLFLPLFLQQPTYFVLDSRRTGVRIVGSGFFHLWGFDEFSIEERLSGVWRKTGALKRRYGSQQQSKVQSEFALPSFLGLPPRTFRIVAHTCVLPVLLSFPIQI